MNAIIELRLHGYTIAQIAALLELSITEVCEVIYNQNNIDKYTVNNWVPL